MLLVVSLAPAAGAMELSQPPAAASSATSTVALPVFLDAARLPDFQDAWRAHFGLVVQAATTPVVPVTADAEAVAISEARQTLTRGEQVSTEAATVRDRAEALSRRFAADPDGTSAPTPDPSPAPVSPEDATVTETASVEPAASEAAPVEATAEAPAQLQNVSATINVPAGGDLPPPSMVGGPRVEDTAASEAAPVIEDMAKEPAVGAKRAATLPPPVRRVAQTPPEAPGFFASVFPGSGSSAEETPRPDDPDKNPLMPRELRSLGWNAQP